MLRKKGRAGVEGPRAGEAGRGGGPVAESPLDPGRDQPATPVLLVTSDRLADRAAGGRELTGRLLHQRELKVRRGGPRLDPRRVGSMAPRAPQVPAADVRLASAHLDVGE